MLADALANDLISLHSRPRQVPPFASAYPGLTADAGYEAARTLHKHRVGLGWKSLGRKIGFTNRTIWPRYGVYEPIWGWVYDRTVHHAAANRGEVSLEGLVQPRIEPELCFGMKATPASAEPRALLEAIEWIAHSFEIVHCYHPGWKLSLADSTAANGLHGRLLLGAKVPIDAIAGLRDLLPAVKITLKKNGSETDRGVGENVLGSPLLALSHLVGVLDKQGAEPLRAGEIVTTGTITDAHPVAAGETWSTQIDGLPLEGLTVRFA